MKKYVSAVLALALICTLAGCGQEEPVKTETVLRATVTEIQNQTMLVTPVDGSQELSSADCFSIPIQNMPASPEPRVGDVVEITYNGGIMETYPAQLGSVTGVVVVDTGEFDG